MTTSLTITPPGGQADERTFAAWGIADGFSGSFRSMQPDELQLTRPGDAETTLAPYRSKVELKLNDKPFFTGVLVSDQRRGSGSQPAAQLRVAGPWWFFGAQFQVAVQSFLALDSNNAPTYETKYLSHFTLNRNGSGSIIGSRAQIVAILDYISAQVQATFGYTPFQYTATDIVDVPVLCEDRLNPTADECLRKQFELIDAVAWFDHSVSPPRFYAKRRSECTAATYTYRSSPDFTAVYPTSHQLARLSDREVTYVKICYEKPYTTSYGSWPLVTEDIYPLPQPSDEFFPLIATVPLRGFQNSTTEQLIKTAAVSNKEGTHTPTQIVAFWQTVREQLADVTQYKDLTLIAGSCKTYVLDTDGETWIASTRTTPLPRRIVEGQIHDWFTGTVERQLLKAKFSYEKPGSLKAVEHEFTVEIDATDLNCPLPDGTVLTNTVVQDLGESVDQYLGIAQTCYEDLNRPAYEGTINLCELTYSGTVKLGLVANLAGTVAGYATANALVQAVSFQVQTGCINYALEVGANKFLTPGNIVDRLRAMRQAQQTVTFIIKNGELKGSRVVGAKSTAARKNTDAPAVLKQLQVTDYTDPADISSPVLAKIDCDPAKATTILAATTPTPVTVGQLPAGIEPREIQVCDPATGAVAYQIFLCGAPYTKPS